MAIKINQRHQNQSSRDLKEWRQLFREFNRLGLADTALRTLIVLRNNGKQAAKRYWDRQLCAKGL